MSQRIIGKPRLLVVGPSTAPAPPPPITMAQSTGYARALWRIASADVTAGNVVELYSDGDEVFDAMVELIDGAVETVALESYIFRHDSTGQRIARALARAARRGVAVRVLGDWIGMRGTAPSFVRQMRQSGVEVRIFNPPGLRRWLGLVPRDHRKLLVVDSAVGITGGVGIGDEWRRGLLRPRRTPWRDRSACIRGPAGADLMNAFESIWRRASGERLPRSTRILQRAARRGSAGIEPTKAPPALVAVVEGEPGRMRVGRVLHLQAAAAERSIWLATAYFIPSFAEVDALTGAADDGIDVRLLLPSRNDHPWVYHYQRRYYRRLLAHGVRIWEWQGDMMHAKTSVVDGHWTRVGSTDYNPLGVAVNFELDVYVNDGSVGARAEDLFMSELAMSREVRRLPCDP